MTRKPEPEPAPPAAARMAPADVLRTGAAGLRARPLRVVLSALGIAIGIAAMVCVTGISASSREDLNRQLAELGTNLLTVSPGQTLGGEESPLPAEAPEMIARIGPVQTVSATGKTTARVYRTDLIPEAQNNSLAVRAAALDLPAATGAEIASGSWLNDATAAYPAVVLGSTAAERLGVHRTGTDVLVRLGDRWFTVTGILHPAPLAPELDTSALVGWPAAESELGFDGYPTTVYARTAEHAVEDVQAVLGATANPAAPNEVQVSRPSDALAAKQAADDTLGALLLGLGAVSLLVGGVGVANTMVISVLERRAEIGLRRSLGATRGQIRTQFLVESQLFSALGGAGGVLLGIAVTAGYAASQGWPAVVPAWAMGGGLAATLLIGACAGLYPALRAARLAPTEALATAA
ncbi:ABC transporter permease [Streptomyces aidingensis]|uniref:Putative ABC transport system permease protein n=1 Tax=Streptomyces aidingensis TaxID=910347 RepID=A0A1I1UYH7_9ACTN|nr:ABC transporter permease [Streptomyces aidingensis]SFD75699.1 putative ABC transport system permease protein [Streptomyces aidingensis]